MEHAQHPRQKSAANRTAAGETAGESPMRPGDSWRKRRVDELTALQRISVPQRIDDRIGRHLRRPPAISNWRDVFCFVSRHRPPGTDQWEQPQRTESIPKGHGLLLMTTT